MGTFMQSRGYGAQNSNSALNSFHSVFGNNDTNTPSLLDLSEFPSLTNARGNDTLPQTNILQTPGGKPYGNRSNNFEFDYGFLEIPKKKLMSHFSVGMVKQPTAEQTEFQMSSEDFPALPGTQLTDGLIASSASQHIGMNHSLGGTSSSAVSSGGGGMTSIGGSGIDCGNGAVNMGSSGSNASDSKGLHHGSSTSNSNMEHHQSDSISVQEKAFKRGIQTTPDGKCNYTEIFFFSTKKNVFFFL